MRLPFGQITDIGGYEKFAINGDQLKALGSLWIEEEVNGLGVCGNAENLNGEAGDFRIVVGRPVDQPVVENERLARAHGNRLEVSSNELGAEIVEIGWAVGPFHMRQKLVAAFHNLECAIRFHNIDKRTPYRNGGVVQIGDSGPVLMYHELAGSRWLDVEVGVQDLITAQNAAYVWLESLLNEMEGLPFVFNVPVEEGAVVAVRIPGGGEAVRRTQRADAFQHFGHFSGVHHGHARVTGLYEALLKGFVLKYLSQNVVLSARLAEVPAVRGKKFVDETDERGHLVFWSEAFN